MKQELQLKFEMITQMYLYNNEGVVFGKKGVYPQAGSGAVRVYFNNAQIQITGSVDMSTISSSGNDLNGAAGPSGTSVIFKIKNLSVTGDTANKVVTLHTRVVDNELSVWVEGYDAICKVKLSTSYEAGTVGLISKSWKAGGGYKAVWLRNFATDTQPEPEVTATPAVVGNSKVIQLLQ